MLARAIEPVADRLLKKYAGALDAFRRAEAAGDEGASQSAAEETEVLQLFKTDMAAYVRLYTFLSQIFDYGATALEKRAIFFRRLLPLLDRTRSSARLTRTTR